MRFKTKSKDVLYKKTGIAKPDAKTLMLDAVGMLPTLMGAPISTTKALQQLGKSASKLRKVSGTEDIAGWIRRDISNRIIPPTNVRSMAANIKRSPKEALEPLTGIKYKKGLGSTLAQNIREVGSSASRTELNPRAGTESWFHDLTHAVAHGSKGERNLKGYLSSLLETSSKTAELAVERAKGLKKIGKKDEYYFDKPIEQHARLTSWALPKGKETIPMKAYDMHFNRSAKVVLKQLKKDWPKLHRKTLKDVAGQYREAKRRAARVLPETTDEWLRRLKGDKKNWSTVFSPKSKKLPVKKIKTEKKLTPGEIARALQDAAEAKGPPRYMRRKAD